MSDIQEQRGKSRTSGIDNDVEIARFAIGSEIPGAFMEPKEKLEGWSTGHAFLSDAKSQYGRNSPVGPRKGP